MTLDPSRPVLVTGGGGFLGSPRRRNVRYTASKTRPIATAAALGMVRFTGGRWAMARKRSTMSQTGTGSPWAMK